MNFKATVLLSSLALWGAAALAQQAPAKPEPDWTVTGNATLISDYRFRGFTQTGFGPALQGGIDVAHKSGFYAGNWNSNVANTLYNGATLEMDLYGGYKGEITSGLGFDVGAIYYAYPRSGKLFPGAVKIDNKEIYGGLSYGPVSAKLYYSLGDYFKTAAVFAAPNSTKGTTYLDLSYSQDFGGWIVGAHYGLLSIKNNNQPTIVNAAVPPGPLPKNIADYKLSIGKDVYNGYVLTAALVGTSKKFAFANGNFGDTGAAGKTALLLSVGKTF